MPAILKLPITCDCGHVFKIDPAGVDDDTDIICPSCGSVDHLDEDRIADIEQELFDALSDMTDDDDFICRMMDAFLDEPKRKVAVVIE